MINIVELLDDLSWIVKLSALLVSISVVYKFMYIPIRDLHKKTTSVVDRFEKEFPILEQIAKDFKPNGGNSLRDVIDRIERRTSMFDEKFKLLIELENVGIFETDMNGKYVWVSEKWMQITGQNSIESSNHGWISDVHPDDRDKVFEQWEKAIHQSRQFHMKYRIGEGNNFKTVETVAFPIKNRNEVFTGYLGRVYEITAGEQL